MDLSKQLRDPWGTLEVHIGLCWKDWKGLGDEACSSMHLRIFGRDESPNQRAAQLNSENTINRFLANPTSLRVLLQGLRFSYDFNLKPSGMWECCGQPGSVYVFGNSNWTWEHRYQRYQKGTRQLEPLWHGRFQTQGFILGFSSVGWQSMKAWEVSRCSNPGKSQLQHLVGMYETHSTSMMLEPRRPSSVHSPFFQHLQPRLLDVSERPPSPSAPLKAGRSSKSKNPPSFVADLSLSKISNNLPMGNSRSDGWHTAIMIIMEMKMMKYTTSSLGLYCSLNLFDPSAAAEGTCPKIIQNSSSKFSKWSLSVYPFPLAVLPGSSASFRRSAWPEIVGERLVDRGL